MSRSQDRVKLEGLSVLGWHGVFDHERQNGQTFVVDVTLFVDLAAAGSTDDLSKTIDYGAVAEVVVRIVGGEPRNLIESVGADVAEAILTEFDVEEVEVTIHKPEAPIPHSFADVSVTIRRSR